MLSGLNHSDLNYVLVHINTAALFEVAGRHTMELLTSPQQRLPDLTTLTRRAFFRACSQPVLEALLRGLHMHQDRGG